MHFSPNDTNYLASLRLANFHCKQHLDLDESVFSSQSAKCATFYVAILS